MSKVGIITDTTSCLPPELVKEYDIRIVPVGLVIGGKHYNDTDLTNDEFWKLFHAADGASSTTAVNPAEFDRLFTDLGKSTDSIICIVVSKALSATHQTAVKGREMAKKTNPELNIEIVDSKTSAGALGFLVLEAARAAQSGKGLEAVVQTVNDMIPRVKFLTVLDTLKYLIKSGRAPKAAVIGDLLGVKPIIGMVSTTGLVENMGRARGKKKAVAKIIELAKEHIDTSKPMHFMVHYTDSLEAAEKLKSMVAANFDCTELYLTPYTPVMASATGPVLAISFYS